MPPKNKTSGKGSSGKGSTSTRTNASNSQAKLAKLFVPNKKGLQNISIPSVPDNFPVSLLDRPVGLEDINGEKAGWGEAEMRRVLYHLRGRMAILLEKAIKAGRSYLFKYRDDSGNICTFSLRAAFRFVTFLTVTEELINFLISRFTGFRRREKGDDADSDTTEEDVSDADLRVAAHSLNGKNTTAADSILPKVRLSGPSTESQALVPVHLADVFIVPNHQYHSDLEGTDWPLDHCFGMIVTGLRSGNEGEASGSVEKRCLYFDPMTNVQLDGEELEDIEDDTEDALFERRAEQREETINNRGAKQLQIEQRLEKICASFNKETGAGLKVEDFKIVFVEIDGYIEFGGGIAVANTICKIARDPTLVTKAKIERVPISEPANKKAKTKTEQPAKAYQLERQDVLFDFEAREYSVGAPSVVAWIRVLTFAEASLSGDVKSEADEEVLDCEDLFFEDHHVDEDITEGWLKILLYTKLDTVACNEYFKAESRMEWGKCFFIAFGRLPNLDG